MMKDGHSLSTKDLTADLTNKILGDEKQKSTAKLPDI